MLEALAEKFARQLVSWPSVTGTQDEAAFAGRLANLLGEWRYFKDNPGDLIVVPVPDDANLRSAVVAIVRGTGAQSVILTGHFDVVPIDNYGDLAPLAYDPDALSEALIARLEKSGADPKALDDLRSGTFIPGRGMLDMKSGLAAGLAVLKTFSQSANPQGTLIFIAVPDEEENSCGMRAISAILPDLLQDRAIDPVLAINLDATCDNEDGTEGRVVTMGTIGKVLLSATVIGKDSHACYPFDGVNAGYLAAALAVEFECAADLGAVTDGEIAAPPTLLASKDNKRAYNVTTPGRAFAIWNVLMHDRAPETVFARAVEIAREAVDRASQRLAERARQLSPDLKPSLDWRAVRVMRFSELMKIAREAADFAERYQQALDTVSAAEMDLPEASRALTEALWDISGLKGTAVIIGNASMPYPAVLWGSGGRHLMIDDCLEEAMARIGQAHETTIARKSYFPAISDISFLGERNPSALYALATETPLWGSRIDLGTLRANIPTINIGPWGRDYHHWLERAHRDYTFKVLPALVSEVAESVLARANRTGL